MQVTSYTLPSEVNTVEDAAKLVAIWEKKNAPKLGKGSRSRYARAWQADRLVRARFRLVELKYPGIR